MAPTVLLYDHDCNFCVWMIALVLRHDGAGALRPVPIQSPEGDALLADLDPGRRLASWHTVSPAGGRRSGGDAFEVALGAVPRLAPLGRLAARAPAGLRDAAYRLVARRRVQLSRLVPSASKRRARALVGDRR